MAALDAPSKVEPPVSVEEAQRRAKIGRDYVIGRFRQHNEIDHDLTCKIKLKQHALKMLPPGRLRDEALKIDERQVAPLWRHIAVWTPPIPGYDPTEFAEKKDE